MSTLHRRPRRFQQVPHRSPSITADFQFAPMKMEVDTAYCEPELTTNAAACGLCVPASISPRRLLSGGVRKSYQKLPQQPLKLFVIKLDGSSFEIQVAKTATVAQLKGAVKDVFHQSPVDDEMISWAHVWGHFCLCYQGEKLLDYKAQIRLFGIKDGDQIFFVRHASITHVDEEKRRMGLWRKRICDDHACEQLVNL